MIKLYEFQEEYMKHVKPNWIYAVDVGLGKSIMALEHYNRYFKGSPVLIVAPKSKIIEGGWDRAINDFVPDMKYENLSYAMLHKKYKEYKEYFIIFDECHNLKNSTSQRGKAGFELTKISKGFIGLSATPMGNGWLDSINYFKMFGFVKNKTQFIRNEAVITTRFGYMEILGWNNEAKLQNMWRQISRKLTKEEAIDLPPITYEEVYFTPSDKYKIIKKDRVLDNEVYDNQMKLRHALRLYTNLEEKINYLQDFINNTTDNIIVFYNYDKELELIKDVIDKDTYIINGDIKNIPSKDEWDKINNSVIICNYKSGSEAIELTFASIIIYFSPTESYIEWEQSLGRAHRIGQSTKVTIYKFITKKSIEEDIYKSLDRKEDFNYKIWERKNIGE